MAKIELTAERAAELLERKRKASREWARKIRALAKTYEAARIEEERQAEKAALKAALLKEIEEKTNG